jgi:hypothetical protein
MTLKEISLYFLCCKNKFEVLSDTRVLSEVRKKERKKERKI